ncbi:MAG TPA: heavy metal translocating P-type ATPase [Anaerolineales bacterium]|nr:heavy metal translocating P-type ATPase [Anaerolineales bacterium]HRQ93096.1 heavy metal translocating P-type ATPase [Anaerolineales bacterium]
MENKVKLELNLVLPQIDAADDCASHLTQRLSAQRGISQAHITQELGSAQLCLHYDPNLISLASVERLAQKAGAEVSSRYRHEQIAFSGLNVADAALAVQRQLEALPGMLHANVNYAAGLIFLAYDTQQLSASSVRQTLHSMGVREVASSASAQTEEVHEHAHGHGHDHGSAPTFLPHWMQERWTLILVAFAALFFLAGWLGPRLFGFSPATSNLFYILAYLAGGYDVATHALPALFKGKLDTDILMLAAAAGAAVLGELGEGAFLLLLFAIGHAGEHFALDRARNAINALGALMPKTAQVQRNGKLHEEPVENLAIGDVVLVRPGDRVPVDGEVLSGNSQVDQSPITGESVPVAKAPGDEVFAGTVNSEQALEVRVSRIAADNTLARVMQLVAEAQNQQSPTQQFADRFTSRFVPAVFILTALFIAIPPLLGLTAWQESFYRGMLLLVAASPCALAIGTPAAVLAGIAQAARNGVLIKGGVHLENLGRLTAIGFDKTGTLTSGRFTLTDVLLLGNASVNELLALAGAVEQQSNHPLAQAIVRAARESGLELGQASGLENVPGRGVRSRVDGKEVLIGTPALLTQDGGLTLEPTVAAQLEQLQQAGRTTMLVSHGQRVLGILGLADTARSDVQQVMQQLRGLGIQHLVMLTGDNRAVAENIARQVGISEVRAELMPQDKLDIIRQMESQYDAIAMVGDGVNDAPALATATVGIAMGGAGTAVALETADVALMGDDLSRLPFAVGLSRASRGIIQQNLMISLGVIGLLVVSSVLGLVQLGFAVLLHEGSTLLVVGNALRLLRYKQD